LLTALTGDGGQDIAWERKNGASQAQIRIKLLSKTLASFLFGTHQLNQLKIDFHGFWRSTTRWCALREPR
jgi:hypothetical protein